MNRFFALAAGAMVMAGFAAGRLSAQDTGASCVMCQATYVPASELAAYEALGRKTGVTDQQVRSIDIGRSNVQIAVVHRGALAGPAPNSVAEHDLVTEVYYILSGSATNVTGPELVGAVRRPEDNRAVRLLNGPGHNAAGLTNAATHQLNAGDVFVIPAGTGHQFTRIEDHITYLMVRVDPDKVVPMMDADDSRRYLDQSDD